MRYRWLALFLLNGLCFSTAAVVIAPPPVRTSAPFGADATLIRPPDFLYMMRPDASRTSPVRSFTLTVEPEPMVMLPSSIPMDVDFPLPLIVLTVVDLPLEFR